MPDGTEKDKGAKKTAKAAAKTQKKESKAVQKALLAEQQAATQSASPTAGHAAVQAPPQPAGPTPAERSAAAAEQQVKLHNRRMWISLIGVLVALMTLTLGFMSMQ